MHTTSGRVSGPDTLDGGSLDDNLWGGAGDNLLRGFVGNDNLFGELGNDQLVDGAGNNVLTGGLGNDTYQVTGGTQQLVMDDGGTDIRVASDVYASYSTLYRELDTLLIARFDGSLIQIDRQWLAVSRVEGFLFADGYFSAADIERRAMAIPPDQGSCESDGGGAVTCQ